MLGSYISYFVDKHSDSTKMFSETDIINLLEFLIDNIFAMFGGRGFQDSRYIPIGTICAPLLAYLFLHSHDANLMLILSRKPKRS